MAPGGEAGSVYAVPFQTCPDSLKKHFSIYRGMTGYQETEKWDTYHFFDAKKKYMSLFFLIYRGVNG